MKKILFAVMAIVAIMLTGCEKGDDHAPEDISKKELFRITDKYVRLLDTVYESFGINGNHIEKTSDGVYQVAGIGRLIAVKILKYAPNSEYEELEREIDKHYDKDYRVNDVFLNNGGTITIDCRN